MTTSAGSQIKARCASSIISNGTGEIRLVVVGTGQAVAGLNHPRTFRKTPLKNLITRGRIQIDTANPTPITKKTRIGRNRASTTATITSASSARLTTTFETGSGLVLISARVAALVP